MGTRGVYALFFVTQLADLSIVPLLPTLAREHGLTHVQTASLLSVTVLVTLVVSVPAGLLTDRFGAKTLAVGSAAIVGASCVAIALADGYWSLLAARGLFGIAYGTVWTAGIAMLAASGRRATALSGAMAVAGTAGLVGPASAGYLAELAGVAAPFAVLAVVAAAVTLLLARSQFEAAAEAEPSRLLSAFAAARRDRRLLVALVSMSLVGLMSGTTNLLLPLRLDAAGLSSGQIGTAFAAAGVVSILASLLASRTPDRRFGLTLAGATMSALGLVWLLPAISATVAAACLFLVASAFLRSPLNAVSYAVGQAGAVATGVGTGAVVGLMNLGWGIAAFAGPLIAGALVSTTGISWLFAAVALIVLPVGAWMLLASRPRPLGRLEHAGG